MTRGSATTDDKFAYFSPRNSTSVYKYEWRSEEWEELPSCPCLDAGVVIIENELTAVGGARDRGVSNKLFTLQDMEWVEKYPPMDIARCHPAVVSISCGSYVVAIGGGHRWNNAVELLHVEKRKWYTLTGLPEPLAFPSATVCGDILSVVGRDAYGYSCVLQDLPSYNQPSASPGTLIWNPLPPLPATGATVATLCGELVIVGGLLRAGSTVKSLHQLLDGEWVEICSQASGTERGLVASVSHKRIVMVGGFSSNWKNQSYVEEYYIVG